MGFLHHQLIPPPPWVMPGARYDLDFANKRYYRGHVSGIAISQNGTIGSLVQGPSATTSLRAPDIDGNVVIFAANEVRVTKGLGLWAEGNYTNFVLQCRDHTQASWAKTTMAAVKNQTGADGTANAASSLTASANNATSLQALTLTSNTYVFSAYVKRITGSGTVSITLDGTNYTDITSPYQQL
jgi:hypothetical protein